MIKFFFVLQISQSFVNSRQFSMTCTRIVTEAWVLSSVTRSFQFDSEKNLCNKFPKIFIFGFFFVKIDKQFFQEKILKNNEQQCSPQCSSRSANANDRSWCVFFYLLGFLLSSCTKKLNTNNQLLTESRNTNSCHWHSQTLN